ncbi:ClC family H(+)/Cl(-) exchange transporter [Corynebacterium bovis]|uniref:ClC family H(+)/Cl(-) exchange transporter n=3 Tax=Corynebacterium bovis TaxID=36808 RepID=A0A3R8QLT6_9CORY|nr:ClC family H(+)/Cl(-) exchange transporter [Corynebacterium bovis]WJY77384.1 H(+)/Cl(-) exchange transporter ClcA [Corynebacterium bovis DSM 20582 = CIP 54.80]QQC47599.1 ClC family H(+)/Cl(-) exchange transporter [Corynebacterium bovis]RRO81131.1 ClC family H(+)/Cl(-) exchange transporter [Corynebacterium bovis]RRO81742.1 ClC family H(+)/Cl(-) exchange transporter [Corynebacterium bovis]RRO83842.1 ClC family H(+)/Cl(-) exchange transporter [Corynebacterium bovis]
MNTCDPSRRRRARRSAGAPDARYRLGVPSLSVSPHARSLTALTALAAVVGALTGLVAATFQRCLEWLGSSRTGLIARMHELATGSPLTAVGLFALSALVCATCAAVAAALVARIEPAAAGSGIPRIEATVSGIAPADRLRILPVKYVGGLLAIGSGLALGREGPLVQMGGSLAVAVNKVARLDREDLRVLIGSGAAAGLATAFSAPIAGGVFVLEELLKRFDVRTSIAALTSSGVGFISARLIVGSEPVLHMPPIPEPRPVNALWIGVVGVVCGLLGVLYNWLVVRCMDLSDRITLPRWAKAAAVGVLVAAIGWFAPQLVGGGDNLTESALAGTGTIPVVIGVLALRYVLGPVSYATNVPGGLFAPMLVLGTHVGLLVGLVAEAVVGATGPSPAAMALTGMAAFFASTVQAPVTGLVLATEMTDQTTMLPPMLGACAISLLVATALRSVPIYERLARRSALTTGGPVEGPVEPPDADGHPGAPPGAGAGTRARRRAR